MKEKSEKKVGLDFFEVTKIESTIQIKGGELDTDMTRPTVKCSIVPTKPKK